MKKLLIGGMVAASMFATQVSQAATICDVKTGLNDARNNLVEMVKTGDKAGSESALRIKVNEATTKLEEAYTAMLGDDNKADDADLEKFKETWEAFKKTREENIMPALAKGTSKGVQEAKSIAGGVQKQRMGIMNGVIQTHGGDDCK